MTETQNETQQLQQKSERRAEEKINAGSGITAQETGSGENRAAGPGKPSGNSSGRQNKMATQAMTPLVFGMAVPLMFSLLVQSLYNIVDSIFVARLSEDSLTATSLAYPVQVLMIAVSVGTAVGMNARLAKLVGMKKHEDACRVATTGLILSLFSALACSILGILFAGKLANVFTSDPDIAAQTAAYLRVCMLFCFGSFLEMIGQRMLQAVGDTVHSMVSLICGAAPI